VTTSVEAEFICFDSFNIWHMGACVSLSEMKLKILSKSNPSHLLHPALS